jgi:cellulose synthase/poly-beta-1,6-N-acetylglucosamine synthase-like glycosyltransferase
VVQAFIPGGFSWLGSSPIPLGIAIVAILCGIGLYFWVCRLRALAESGSTLHPILPAAPPKMRGFSGPLDLIWRTQPLSEKSLEIPEGVPPTRLERRLADLRDHARRELRNLAPPVTIDIPENRGYRAAPPRPTGVVMPPLPEGGGPAAASVKPPQASKGFGWKITVVFVALLFPLVAFWSFFYSAFNIGVQSMGAVLYWPKPWSGWGNVPQVDHTLAALIFLVYVAYMLAYLLVSGLFVHGGRFTEHQRIASAIIFVGYMLSALLVDAIMFTLPVVLLVLMALLGGIFFMMLLFASLMKPPPLNMPPVRVRDRSVLYTFLGTIVLAFAGALLVLYLMWQYLGIGQGNTLLVQIRILVLLPLLTYTFWVIEGRLLYSHELRKYPPAPLSSYHPEVTIIIPAYNEQVGIQNCIRCIDGAARLYPGPVEILVANDGSTDRTSELAHEELKHLHIARGRCIDLPHGGKARALNSALSYAKGEIVIRVDADSFMSPAWGFGPLIGHLANPRVGGVQGLILPLQREGWTRKLRMLELTWRHMFLFRALMGTRTIQVVDGVFSAFRRKDLLKYGGWVAWNGEDCEITLRLQRAGYTMRYEPVSLIFEDVPPHYPQLKKQRVRWSRGSYFAHGHHFGAFFSDAPEYCSLAMLYWLTMYARGGLRFLSLIFIALVVLMVQYLTVWTALLLIAIVLLPKGIAMAYYLCKMRFYSYLPWIFTWPVTSLLKQYFSVESWGTIFPGAMPEFSE